MTGGASTIYSPRWPPPGSLPGSHPTTGLGTPLDPLDAILDKDGAEDKLLEYDQQRMSIEQQMNPTLYVAGDSNQSINLQSGPDGEWKAKQRGRPGADAAAAQRQLGRDFEAIKGSS